MMSLRAGMLAAVAAGCVAGGAWGQGAPVERAGGKIDLPSSKQIVGVAPGEPQRLGSTPVAMAVSPDGRYVVTVNGGYGSFESGYMQSLAVMDTRTGTLEDFPDPRTLGRLGQVLFSGLAFSADGKHLYGSVASASDPEGKKDGDTGSGVQVYGFDAGRITRERVLKIPLQKLAAGRKTMLVGGVEGNFGLPYPSAVAVVREIAPKNPERSLAIPRPDGGNTTLSESLREDAEKQIPELKTPELTTALRWGVLVAGNLSDDVLLLDATSGKVLKRFDLSESSAVPGAYPVAVVAARGGRRAFVALSNASEVVELDLVHGTVGRKLALLKPQSSVVPGSRPTALAMSPDGQTMYVALGNRDAVAAVDLSGGGFKLKGYYDTRLPGQSFYGAIPEALAVNADGSRLYVANMGSDAVAVIDTKKLTKSVAEKGMAEPIGFIPTEWMPMGVAFSGGKIYIASGKGTGTGPNNYAQRATPETKDNKGFLRAFTFIPTLLHGSLAVVEEKVALGSLKEFTAEVLEDNRMKAGAERIQWGAGVLEQGKAKAKYGGSSTSPVAKGATGSARNDDGGGGGAGVLDQATAKAKYGGSSTSPVAKGATGSAQNDVREGGPVGFDGPIRHVIYVIKENRTYDQVLGDLTQDGRPVGNGDASLTMYGAEVTPNTHKLALQFGVLDNFYDSGEVSGDGHVWSNAAINSDYNERTWQLNYRGAQRGYDFEGVVAQGIPLEQHIPDVAEPGTGYLWGNAERHGRTHYNFGEFIASTFCTKEVAGSAQKYPQMGPLLEGKTCAQRNEVKPGERLPVEWGGGVNKWPWAIPLLASNKATKPELVGHFAEEAPDFNLRVPDQVRVDVFLRHLDGWVADRKAGNDTMPNFITMRLGNDHTAGTMPGGPTPKASVADNDLAVGRIAEAISHSAYWDDTMICVLEDDAQNGADHVDAHRSLALVVSKYAPHGAGGAAFVDSRFYSTVSMVRTMETVLGLPPMNNNDAFSSMMGSLLTGAGDQPAYTADASNEANGLIYTANKATAAGARASAKMDFTHEDRADASKLNVILWQDAMGSKPVPAMLTQKRKATKKDDDD